MKYNKAAVAQIVLFVRFVMGRGWGHPRLLLFYSGSGETLVSMEPSLILRDLVVGLTCFTLLHKRVSKFHGLHFISEGAKPIKTSQSTIKN